MAEVPGIDREAYRGPPGVVLDLVITERSQEYGLGWILPKLMQDRHDITYSGGQMDRELDDLNEYWTNEFNPKIMPAS